MSKKEIYDQLLTDTWVDLPPDRVLQEIEKTMISIGVTDKYFKFKTLSPIHPVILQRITEPDYWKLEQELELPWMILTILMEFLV